MPDPLVTAVLLYRDDLAESGRVTPADLPLESDLTLIASTPDVTRAMIDSLPLERPDLLKPFAAGVMGTIKAARRELAAQPPAAPPTPYPSEPTAPGPSAPEPVSPEPSAPEPPAAAEPPPAADETEDWFAWGRDDAPEVTAPEPAAAPEPAPEPVTGRRRGRRAEPEPAAPALEGFAAFDVATATYDDTVPSPRTSTTDAGLRLVWDAREDDDGVVLYRVVSREDVQVWNPDEAHAVAVTPMTSATDDRPFTSAARHYAVYAHAGPDEAAARAAPPVLVARGAVVAPPGDLQVKEDHGTAYLSWTTAEEGVLRVEVLRVPAQDRSRSGYLSEHRVADVTTRPAQRGRGSYQDGGCRPGEKYEYRLFSVWTDPTTGLEEMSAAARVPLAIPAVLSPVREVVADTRQDGERVLVDLSWEQAPGAEVVVYRTQDPPPHAATEQDLDVSALSGAGLRPEEQLPGAPEVSGGRGRVDGANWPPEWPRVTFTPVTLSGSTARVGRSVTLSRTDEVQDPRLVQRVHWQLLTFDWPASAVSVDVHRTPRGVSLEDYQGEVVARLTQVDYKRFGGTRLTLPAEGCAVHLVPKSFFGRREVAGTPTSLDYEGLFVLHYALTTVMDAPQAGRFWNRGAAPAVPTTRKQLSVHGSGPRPGDTSVVLRLVTRRDRIPLSPEDGERELWSQRVALPGSDWVALAEVETAGTEGSWLRLFAECDGLEVALIDPHPVDLRP